MSKKYNYFDNEGQSNNTESMFNLISVDRTTTKRSVANTNTATKKSSKKATNNHAEVFERLSSTKASKWIKDIAKNSDPKTMSKKQKWIMIIVMILIFVAVIAATVVLTFSLVTKEAKSQSEFQESAGAVCMEYEEMYGAAGSENLSDKGVLGARMTGLCYIRDIDFNGDKQSELLLCYRQGKTYNYEIWGYSGNSFVMLHKAPLHQTDRISDHAWFTIYSKNGKNYIVEHDKKNVKKATIYELRGTKFVRKEDISFDTQTGDYRIKGKPVPNAFERVKMAVIHPHEAAVLAEKIQDKVDSYIGKTDKKSGHAQKVNMMNAYYNIIIDYNNKYGEAEYVEGNSANYIDGLAYVSLIDFNNDDVDELILAYRRPVNTKMLNDNGEYVATTVDRYFCDVYAWNGTNAWRVYQQEGLGNMQGGSVQRYILLKHTSGKTLLCFNSFTNENYGRTVEASSKMLKFNGQTFVATHRAWYSSEYGYTEYRLNGSYVNEYQFKQQGGYKVPFFDGYNVLKDTDYTVVYLQTNKNDSSQIENIVPNTVDTIKKINKGYEPSKK